MIRRGKITDIYPVSLLWLEMVSESGNNLNPNVEWWRSHALELINNPVYRLFVAEEKGEIVGFLDYFLFPEPATSKIHCIGQQFFVKSPYRDKDVSGKLYKTVIKDAQKNGAEVFELFCFEDDLHFWKKHGYELKRCLVRK